MNASDILKYGQRTVLQALDTFPQAELETPGACGYWSVKDIIAHLASYECVLVDVLSAFVTPGAATPYLDKMFQQGGAVFNDAEVDLRKARTTGEVLAEFNDAHRQSQALVTQIPAEVLAQPGTLPWYGLEYSLDDYIAYAFYGHKREHSAQIAAFCDVLERVQAHSYERVRQSEPEGGEQTAHTITLAQQVEQALNQRDLNAFMTLLNDDFVFENTFPAPDGQRYVGQAANRAFWADFLNTNPRVDFQIEEIFAHGSRCAVRWVFHWENTAGEQGHVRGIDLLRQRDGKLVEKFSYVKG